MAGRLGRVSNRVIIMASAARSIMLQGPVSSPAYRFGSTVAIDRQQNHRPPPHVSIGGANITKFGNVSDYEKYRRSLCGGLAYKALLVDAAGTLIVPSEPAAKVYYDFGIKYGVNRSEKEILRRYRWAYAQPWSGSRLRYENDARPFWQFIVEKSTGCNNPDYLEELYQYYTTAEAWRVSDPEAGKIFKKLRQAGVKIAVVSNFDTRLRPLLNALKCYDWFDAMAISAEVGAEKPNPAIFNAACEQLGVREEEVVHVGDDRRNDLWGARDAGCDAWLWGEDVTSFKQVAEKIGIHI